MQRNKSKSLWFIHTQNSIVHNLKRNVLKKTIPGFDSTFICIDVHYLETKSKRKARKIHLQQPTYTDMCFCCFFIFIFFLSRLISFKVTFDNFPDCWAYNNISYIYFSVKLRIFPLIYSVFQTWTMRMVREYTKKINPLQTTGQTEGKEKKSR